MLESRRRFQGPRLDLREGHARHSTPVAPAPLERISVGSGCIRAGWVGAGVLYASYEGALGAEVGERYAARLSELVSDVSALSHFIDASDLSSYDLLARSAILRAIMAERRKFTEIVALTWAGGIGPIGRSFAATLGNIEYVTTRDAFDERLFAAAPLAREQIALRPSMLRARR